MNTITRKVITISFFLTFYCFNSKAETINVGDTLIYNTDYVMNKDFVVNGVLIVDGNFKMGSVANLTLGDNATIIVSGDFSAANKVNINTSGTFIIGGSLTIEGSAKGEFNYTGEGIAQVYIGGDVSIPYQDKNKDGINDNLSDYPILIEDTGSHESSGNNYGNITDIATELPDVWEEYQEIVCGTAVNSGSIISGDLNPFCGQGNPTVIQEDLPASSNVNYQWYYSTNSTDPKVPTWTIIDGATSTNYDPSVITQSSHYYREAKIQGGCTANSNVVSIWVTQKPNPKGIFVE